MNPLATLEQGLADIDAQGLRRCRRVADTACGAHMTVDGRAIIGFASNDYLGLAAHPRLVEAFAEGARRYGSGSGGSHLLGGHSRAHATLEDELAAFSGGFSDAPRALYFSTGYMANLAALTALAGRGATIFSDALNHASLIDGARLSRANVQIYPHGDADALDARLRACDAPTKLIVSDTVFSMDGDVAPLARLVALAETHGAWLVVDDAHGFGVLGPQGRGALAAHGLRSPNLVYVGTLGKAAGVAGAFVVAHETVIEWLVQRAQLYLHDGRAAVRRVRGVREPRGHRERRRRRAPRASRRADQAHPCDPARHALAARRFAHGRAAARDRQQRSDARGDGRARRAGPVGARDPAADGAGRHVAAAHLAVGRAFVRRSRTPRGSARHPDRSRRMSTPLSLFVTGTDTEIGKTFVSAALLHGFARAGLRAAAMKPVAAGAYERDGAWRNEDADQLDAAANVALPAAIRTPFLLKAPAAPHIVAAREGVALDIGTIVDAHRRACEMADVIVVEGVGGFRVPLADTRDTADLAVALGLPVVLVVGVRLGCISHALLTAEAIAARGLPLAGWVANRIDPAMPFADDNIDTLRAWLEREHRAPLLGALAHEPAVARRGVARARREPLAERAARRRAALTF